MIGRYKSFTLRARNRSHGDMVLLQSIIHCFVGLDFAGEKTSGLSSLFMTALGVMNKEDVERILAVRRHHRHHHHHV